MSINEVALDDIIMTLELCLPHILKSGDSTLSQAIIELLKVLKGE